MFQNYKCSDMAPKKSSIGWCPAWMSERDEEEDKFGDWAEKVDFQTFKCRWCGVVSLLFYAHLKRHRTSEWEI